MSAARPTSTTPLVKQEETAAEAHELLHSGNDVSEADVELLLHFRRDSAQARASTPPTSASRVSISALLNSEEDSTFRNPTTSHAVTMHSPVTPRPSKSSSVVSPVHPSPPLRSSVTSNSTSSNMPALASPSKPPLALERDLDRATKSMSISVEPEAMPLTITRAPSPLVSPVTPRPTVKTKPTKIGKGRGRVSKGPKKRQGKGWIIESCTTSGAASDAELDMDLESGTSESPEQSPEKIPDRKPIVLKQLQELFDGDSDLTDLDDLGGGSSSSSDEQTQEYDPGLAGLPPVPASSDSEYAPRNGSTPRVDVGGETRARRVGRTSLDYGAFQISARPSVRLATRTPTANAQKREARNRKPQAGDQQGPVRRAKSAPKDVDALLTPSSRSIKRARGRPRKSKAPSLSASSVSLGEWQEDRPDEMAAAKVVRDALKGKGKGKADSGTSTLTELTESSPSLGGGKSIMGSSPVRRLKELVMSDAPNLSARSDGGVTHISGSVGDRNDESEEEERLRRVRKFQVIDSDQASEGDEGIQVRDFIHDEMPPRRMSEPNRRRDELRGSLQRFPSASKPSGSAKPSRRRTSVEVVLPPRPKSRRSSFPQASRNISPSRARLLPAIVSTASSNKAQRVYVLLPEPSSAWTSRLTNTTSEASSLAPSEDYSLEESNMEEVSSNGMAVESRSEQSEEPPTKRVKRGTSTSTAARQVKGKGVASRRGSTVPRGRGGRRLSSRLSESTNQDHMEVIPEDGMMPAIEEDRPVQVRRTKKAIIPADTDSLSGSRPRRHSKQTARAKESAEQELGWNDEDMPMVVTIKEKPRRGNSSKFVLHVAETPPVSEHSSAVGSRGKGKGKRAVSAPGEPRPAKRSRKSQAEASPGHALVELREGDYILRPQERRCWNYDFDQTVVSRCVACKKKKFGDTCRFVHVRWFQFKHPASDPVGVKFESPNGETEKEEEPKYHLPYQWNVTPEIKQVERMRVAIARALYPVLKEELAHASKPNVIRRAIEIEVRATCDVCVTSVFSSCHMCTRCGRELCGACFQRVEEMCPSGTPLEYSGSASKDRQLHKYRACSWGRVFHLPADFQPVTRFSRLELEQTVTEMESIIQEQNKNAPAPREGSTSHTAQAQIANWASRVPPWNPTSPHASTEPPALSSAGSSRDVSSSRGTPDPQLPTMPIIASPTMSPTHEDQFSPEVGPLPGKRPRVSHYGRLDPASVPSHPVHHFSKTLLEEEFRSLWARGEAIVVQDLLSEFKLNWTPEYFTSEYGEQRCMVVNCTDNKDTEMMVKDFFEMFGKADREAGILKLKDWPAQADFKDDFPKLYDDFMGALPVPNYTRRDGILNLASHFATNAIAPDLGPKMYNAFTSVEGPGGQGSTRLHMDMADAVNIMMYASKSPDGSPGVAAWDIFRAKDSDKIRAYLRRHFKDRANEFRDPIHSQLFYLDSHHRKKLCDEEQVFSWRIYQRPGDAVFIPAGCAHQVCNLADCIKIAIDFVSIENIDRCEKLTTEFRNENDTFTWKEDVLQLRTMMMYAWRSTTQLRKCWYDELANLEQGGTSEGISSDSSHSADS
ncbi:unnamed protein product [Rhizoctonia solani]|uniref:JmjC domain-containing protein n=1 Tax=Rhizoctonia solani TaxID=456999 RepID=A0A8H3A9T0_9AGAM|nr:unnamed protein product [Rhizoctonia solani]